MAMSGDMRLVSETEAEIFDGSAWVPVPGASVGKLQVGENQEMVVVRVGPDMSPSGNLDMNGFYMGLSGSVSVTAGLSQSGPREFVGSGDEGAPEFSDGGVAVAEPRDPADPMDLNDDNGSSA